MTSPRHPAYDAALDLAERYGIADGQLEEAVGPSGVPSTAPRIVRMSDVQPEAVEWLWPGRIPARKLTILEGDPGVGKSHAALAIATSVSLGRGLPDTGPCDPADVLILSAEDGLADTIRPRLDAMRADVTRIRALGGAVTFDGAGLATVEDALILHRPALLIVDPLVAYMRADLDIHRANAARSVTAALARLAEAHGCAIVAIRHLGKSQRDRAIYRGLGSIDITAAARSVLLAGADPDDSSVRAVTQVKSNLGPLADAIGYTLGPEGFRWLGPSTLTAARILAPDAVDGGTAAPALAEAEEFLKAALADGPALARDVVRDAKAAGLSQRTIERAKSKDRLGVVARKLQMPGKRGAAGWAWSLPDSPRQSPSHTDVGGVNPHIRAKATDSDRHTRNMQAGGGVNPAPGRRDPQAEVLDV